MNGENLAFISHTRRYLEQKAIVCYGATKGTAQKDDINRINGNTLGVTQEFAPTVEFDLVRAPGGYVDLKILGAVGTYGATTRTGRPIVGNYIPYLGQKDANPHSTHFGRVNLSNVTSNFVFTFSFTGCNFVVTRENGDVYVYHEPTADCWTASVAQRYPGATIIHQKVGPAYDDTHVGGFGCLARDKAVANRWHIYAQSPNGIRMAANRLTSATVDV